MNAKPPTAVFPTPRRDLTEPEWLACKDPETLLRGLPGTTSSRQFRLFAVACCRHVGDLLTTARSRKAIELAERVADGQAGRDDLAYAVEEAATDFPGSSLRYALNHLVGAHDAEGAARVAFWASHGVATLTGGPAMWEAERVAQCRFLHCVFGNPFRPAAVDPAWLAWQGRLINTVAHSIYELRHFVEMPLIGLALEQAGCRDPDMLAHCADTGGVHVRGCWVLDLLLGK